MSSFRRQRRFNDAVPHIQTSRKTMEVLRAQFVGTVVDVPLIRPINQATRQAEIPPYQHIDEALLCPPSNQGTKHGRVSADCGDTATGPPRSSADGPQPSSVEEQLLRMVLLMPDTRAMWESISQLSDSAEKDALIKQLCGFIQRRPALAQEYAAQRAQR